MARSIGVLESYYTSQLNINFTQAMINDSEAIIIECLHEAQTIVPVGQLMITQEGKEHYYYDALYISLALTDKFFLLHTTHLYA